MDTKFNSIDEICKEFNINKELDVNQIIKELKQIQANIHPDTNPNFSDSDMEKFLRIEEAKDFLRNKSEQTLVPISDILEIIKSVSDHEMTVKKNEIEVIQDKINTTSEKIIKSTKQYYLSRKITVSSICAILTFLWAFPSMLYEHPIVGIFIDDIHFLYMLLSYIWLVSLSVLLTVLMFTYRVETDVKYLLHFLENIDNQYSLFSDFTKKLKERDEKTFSNKDLESFLFDNIISKRIIHTISLSSRRQLHIHIKDIIPKISEMIIAHALEKGVISKENNISWYNSYKINI